MFHKKFFNLLSISLYFALCFAMLYLIPSICSPAMPYFLLGFIGSQFLWGYTIDYCNNYKMKYIHSGIVLTNIICSVLLYYYSFNFLIVILGVTFSIGSTNLVNILKRDEYNRNFSWFMNVISAITWGGIAFLIYIKDFIIFHKEVFLFIYLLIMAGVLYNTYNQLYEEKNNLDPSLNILPLRNILTNHNFSLSVIFLLTALTAQGCFATYFFASFNIFYHLLGAIIACFLFHFLFPILGMKKSMVGILFLALLIFIIPNSPVASICSGIVGGGSFLSFIYAFIHFPNNIGIIFAFFNVVGFLFKILIFRYMHFINSYSSPYSITDTAQVTMITLIVCYMIIIYSSYKTDK
jgi:hypothetical protein